jgi:hypothetical protein
LSFFIALFFVLSNFQPSVVNGSGQASIFLGRADGTYTVGSTFTVSIYVNTNGNSINAIEANLSFPADKLQVVNPTAGKSLIQIWVNQPSFSNSEGTLKFQGAIPTPGINTESGVVSTITFRVKDTGTATIKVLDSSRVLLNDGQGTDILGQRTGGVYNLILPPPAGPAVISPTNPDQEKWYQNKSVVLRWDVVPQTTGFSYVLNNSPVDNPDDISEGLKTSITHNDLQDGVHYFHIKALREGTWGGVTNYAIKIDNTPPAEFKIEISPSSRTTNQYPILNFITTDKSSGLDHYEIKIIPLSGHTNSEELTPFFIEATSPYTQKFELGKYQIIARAYDEAGNYFENEEKLTITNKTLEIIDGQGLRIKGNFTVDWPIVWVIIVLLIALLGYCGKKVWSWHRAVEELLAAGPLKHPNLISKIEMLKEKQKNYKPNDLIKIIVLGFVLSGLFFGSANYVSAQTENLSNPLKVEPPIVSLFPKAISNDEILYIGGFSNIPEAEIIIYIQNIETGAAQSQSIKSDAKGAWFYSAPKFLEAGKYEIWTQLKHGEELSPPSSKNELEISKTAIQIGENRVSFEKLYLAILSIGGLVVVILIIFILYHLIGQKTKKRRILKEVREAEESVRRGFIVLRRDIEAELSLVRRMKATKELATEEKLREEQLLKDLETVTAYIGKEVWDIEKEL